MKLLTSHKKAVGAGTAGTAGAVLLFQDNKVIVFTLQNLQHATHDSEAAGAYLGFEDRGGL